MPDRQMVTEFCQIDLQLATGEELTGEIFLQLMGARGFGGQRLEELLNGADGFLPFRCQGETTLINLRRVASISVGEDPEKDALMKLGKRHEVSVRTTVGSTLAAEVYVNLPADRCRVKDFLNQKLRFLPFFVGERIVYINSYCILQVKD